MQRLLKKIGNLSKFYFTIWLTKIRIFVLRSSEWYKNFIPICLYLIQAYWGSPIKENATFSCNKLLQILELTVWGLCGRDIFGLVLFAD